MSHSWEPVIGLEIHAQLNTNSKIFSSDSAEFGAGDNENTSPVSLGLPGVLPVLNKQALLLAVRTGLALNCQISPVSVFSRKNYFYPDLPKGYQISQHDKPLCEKGWVDFFVEGRKKRIRVHRAHMEEDAGKSLHHSDHTAINFNRSGVPLLEIVSEPEISSALEAAEYARAVRRILQYIQVCDGNLEEGSMRCDCNVSVRPKGQKSLGVKVEIKNLNSFRFIEKAIDYEIQRQIDSIESGQSIPQETRLYDATKNKTYTMRLKEEESDYRYFPDPDLLPVKIESGVIETIRGELPELDSIKTDRFINEYHLAFEDASLLTQDRDLAFYFEEVSRLSKNPRAAANLIKTDVLRLLNEQKISRSDIPVSPRNLSRLIELVDSQRISGKMAKDVFEEMWSSKEDPDDIVKNRGLEQISDSSQLIQVIAGVLAKFPDQVREYHEGKKKVFGFFVGQIMKETKGQANPGLLQKMVSEELEKIK